MRGRLIGAALAVLLAMGLGIPAFADADGEEEEDFFATALDLARYLEQASGVASVSYVELSGTVDGGEETDVDVELDFAESAYNDYRKAKTNIFAAKRHVWQQMIQGSFARCSLQ